MEPHYESEHHPTGKVNERHSTDRKRTEQYQDLKYESMHSKAGYDLSITVHVH